ncbi:MAG: energy-coupling factor ABC transporter permease [Methanocellales archaeon]
MHIAEGYLPLSWCILYFGIAMPVVAYGIYRLRKIKESYPRAIPLIAVAGGFMFILSALKIPSVTGSCSHPTGTGISIVLFGLPITVLLAIMVLIFQALLLAHGGITTLGANTVSMGLVGPFMGYIVYKVLNKANLKWEYVVFATAFTADIFTYVITSTQIAAAYPIPSFSQAWLVFMAIFVMTQIPIGIAEGLLSVALFHYLVEYRGDLLAELKVLKKVGVNG